MNKRIIVALDYPTADLALKLVATLDPSLCRLKVGNELFTSAGTALIENLQHKGFEIFLDLKYHDIPNTVAHAVASAARLGVWMVNVHTSGGPKMLEAAANALLQFEHKPLLIGVTVLTSMDKQQLASLGLELEPLDQVKRLARLAYQCGLDGVVSSALEVVQIKEITRSDFICVTPGIRPQGSAVNDQKRIMTPQQALEVGADYLVIGRPITQAQNPLAALQEICNSIS